ncbi:hypothetical protein B0G84_3252 [Paraburkholderia sp. BL8N3]|nr:hypothetical protein [Paraburkholderia sp. BL8N3]TCK37954.1 hypothetical protein B0G84_3252 [Paraburkholderia sp. BL8N3]
MNKISFIAAVSLALSLTACAGRTPQPMSVVQQKDTTMDCTAVQAQIQQNTAHSAELGKEKGGKVAQNVAAAAAGVFFPPLWFMMDFQGAADSEQKAIESRNQYLGGFKPKCNKGVNV